MIEYTTSEGETAYVAAKEIVTFDPVPGLNACVITCRNGEKRPAQESAATLRARYDAWERRSGGNPTLTLDDGRQVVRGMTDEGR